MDKTLETLQPLFQTLADFFQVSIEEIQSHGMEYIMMYGRYQFVHGLVWNMIFVGLLCGFCFYLFYSNRDTLIADSLPKRLKSFEKLSSFQKGSTLGQEMQTEIDNFMEDQDKKFTKRLIIIFISIYVIFFTLYSIPYLVCPEAYSIKEFLLLARNF